MEVVRVRLLDLSATLASNMVSQEPGLAKVAHVAAWSGLSALVAVAANMACGPGGKQGLQFQTVSRLSCSSSAWPWVGGYTGFFECSAVVCPISPAGQ